MNNSKLNRRSFLKASAVGVSVLAAAENVFPSELTALPDSISERQIIPLNQGWLFNEKFTIEATKANFNDRSFKLINLWLSAIRWNTFVPAQVSGFLLINSFCCRRA